MNPLYINIIILIICMLMVFRFAKYIFEKTKKRRAMDKLASSGMKYIDKMDGHMFEVFLMALFQKLGYKSKVTQKSRDFGADIILEGKNRIVIQAKRYGFKNKVGLSAVQEIYAAQAYYKAQEAWVITNSQFTSGAWKLAKTCNVKLLSRQELQDLINRVKPDKSAKDVYENEEPSPRVCSSCNSALVVRKSSKTGDRFLGCSSYPSCHHTEKISGS
ncbi:restriction endonuclease [Bacillus subtilis]|uniref:restriction endonuclease n=1 Tax=Bacillus subtilis TaxID=1423 RepID=UPI00295EE5F5|nr:restriction endonuclease [Bacillus subtilis]MEC2297152.1 restriction endonuclease [Bacillus subtilis]